MKTEDKKDKRSKKPIKDASEAPSAVDKAAGEAKAEKAAGVSVDAPTAGEGGEEFDFDTPVFDAETCEADGAVDLDGEPSLPLTDGLAEDGEKAAVAKETDAVAEEADAVAEEADAVAEEADAVAEEADAVAEEADAVTEEADAVTEETDAVAEEADAVAEEADAVAEEADAVAEEADAVAEEAEKADEITAEEADDAEADGEAREDVELWEAIEEDAEEKPAIDPAGDVTPAEENDGAEVRQPSAKKKRVRENGSRRVDGLFDFIELFVFTLAAVLIITSFVVRHSVVEGDSMLGTIHSGETLIISDLFYEPRVGDIVVVDDHSTALKKPIIKRVIAVGGDTVRVTKVGIAVNGVLLDEPYVYTDGLAYTYSVYPSEAYSSNETLTVEVGVYYEFVVPEGELFVLGDHRNMSTDSRDIGTVDVDAVVGRVLLRVFPFDVFGRVE
ncbi:MAG: signal peptidase I [Clostridia bacterium]|nr:signal peptidase I [Clostridia bacterium]